MYYVTFLCVAIAVANLSFTCLQVFQSLLKKEAGSIEQRAVPARTHVHESEFEQRMTQLVSISQQAALPGSIDLLTLQALAQSNAPCLSLVHQHPRRQEYPEVFPRSPLPTPGRGQPQCQLHLSRLAERGWRHRGEDAEVWYGNNGGVSYRINRTLTSHSLKTYSTLISSSISLSLPISTPLLPRPTSMSHFEYERNHA